MDTVGSDGGWSNDSKQCINEYSRKYYWPSNTELGYQRFLQFVVISKYVLYDRWSVSLSHKLHDTKAKPYFIRVANVSFNLCQICISIPQAPQEAAIDD